jgi:hypothetical protein
METNLGKKALREFINDNSSLFSVMAVLAAIFAFISKLPISWLNNIFSFVILAGITIIWLEIKSDIPRESGMSGRLFWFSYVVNLLILGTIFYWVVLYRDFWNIFLSLPLFLWLAYFIHSNVKTFLQVIKSFGEIPFIKKQLETKIIKNILDKLNDRTLIKIVKIIYLIFLFFYSIALSFPLAKLINSLCDLINKSSIIK